MDITYYFDWIYWHFLLIALLTLLIEYGSMCQTGIAETCLAWLLCSWAKVACLLFFKVMSVDISWIVKRKKFPYRTITFLPNDALTISLFSFSLTHTYTRKVLRSASKQVKMVRNLKFQWPTMCWNLSLCIFTYDP